MKLIALRCPSCNNALAPGDDDLVIACEQCGAGVAIDDDGLHPIELRFAVSGTPAAQYQPWWAFEGRVQLNRRDTQSGNRREEALKFWAQPRSLPVTWKYSAHANPASGIGAPPATSVSNCCQRGRRTPNVGVSSVDAGGRPR